MHVRSAKLRLLLILGLLSLVSLGFYVGGVISSRSLGDWYLVWNLFLAWLPLFFAWTIIKFLKHHTWSGWGGTILTVFWFIFLPNSFYIVSDFIHLGDVGQSDAQYDAIMFLMFALSGLLLGYVSLYMIHLQLIRRLRRTTSHILVAIVLLICSYAIYLGRDLRWNSWDAFLHPSGVIFSLSDPFLAPSTHHDAFTTTLTFFVLLGTLYVAGWQAAKIFRTPNRGLRATEPL
jgi:uncharacterized membrane protein